MARVPFSCCTKVEKLMQKHTGRETTQYEIARLLGECSGNATMTSFAIYGFSKYSNTTEEALEWLLETHFPGSQIL